MIPIIYTSLTESIFCLQSDWAKGHVVFLLFLKRLQPYIVFPRITLLDSFSKICFQNVVHIGRAEECQKPSHSPKGTALYVSILSYDFSCTNIVQVLVIQAQPIQSRGLQVNAFQLKFSKDKNSFTILFRTLNPYIPYAPYQISYHLSPQVNLSPHNFIIPSKYPSQPKITPYSFPLNLTVGYRYLVFPLITYFFFINETNKCRPKQVNPFFQHSLSGQQAKKPETKQSRLVYQDTWHGR